MNNRTQLLYITHDRHDSHGIMEFLIADGFDVRCSPDVEKGMNTYKCSPPDLLLLDMASQRANLEELMTAIRERDHLLPVIVCSPDDSIEMEARALRSGADAYVHEGIPPFLLVARLRAIHRRLVQYLPAPGVYYLSGVTTFDHANRILQTEGLVTRLQPTHARLLQLLCLKMNELSSMEYLLHGLWGKAITNKDKVLRKYMTSLRHDLAADKSLAILNNYGRGYTLISRVKHY
jgi:DNA-binding response OmpR family regulator